MLFFAHLRPFRVGDRLKRFLLILTLTVSLLGVGGMFAPASHASIRQQEEAPGQILYQSRQSIRDNQGQTWQVVLFKRVKNGEVDRVDLRLVGYPDQAKFLHPAPLAIAVTGEKPFQAPDQFAVEAPAPNVGQFDLAEILPMLPLDRSIQLDLPLAEAVTLEIPQAVLLEWQLIR